MWTIFKAFIEFFYNIVSVVFMLCFFGHEACGILAPRPGIEPTVPALGGEVLTTGGQPRDLSPNASGGLTPFSPPSELQEIPVATREQSGLLCFHSR